ncbi:diguanylate cyclase [Legionella norrlandica]|uniref:7,8-dihydroneopterin aldolase n=1 Tax=Legionella norrlandica TaxID=1498499 RepID=A0A0A2T7N4_9GAMM|nr:dihydroneopterin aldolase [Legionella norrlandica]KGP63398.1 diguanylate cyclase [Legionella norrlandica]
MDILNITALSVETKIGVYGWEQRINQRLLIDISIPSNFKDCKDNLCNTLDYDDLCQTVTQFVESTSFQLIETVAEQIAYLIKQKYQVEKVSVAVSKPHAVKNAGGIQVIVDR